MQLPFTHKNEPAANRKYVFGLEISPGVTKCAIWTSANNKPQVVAASHSATWDDKTATSLIEAVDKCISDATNHLDPSGATMINEVIFGVPSTWVAQDKIISSKLALLKEMSIQLELKAVGFVVTSEAIIKLLHQNENVPPTAILVGFWEHELEVSLVKMGKIVGSHLVRRSQNVTSDVVEGLSRFEGHEVLPSRMLLYDSTLDLEEIKQLLLQYPWATASKKIPFLHYPKIEVLPGEFSVKAVCLAAGAEVVWEETHPEVEEVIEEASEDLGFVPDGTAAMQQNYETVEPEYEVSQPVVPAKVRKFSWPKVHFSLPSLKLNWLPLVLVVVVILAGLGAGYWFLSKATIKLTVAPKDFQAEATISLSTNTLTTSVDQAQQAPTTGTKIVGDKATGSVSISSTLDSAKSINAGTILTSPSGLKFVTLADVTVASASGSADNLVPGKATVNVTAASIGTDSNLSAGTVFRVDTLALTQVSAKNDVAMSGGSSRQAKAVSQDDVTKLESQIVNQTKQQAQDKLKAQIDDSVSVIPESVNVTIANETLNHKVGEEADNFNLQVTAKASALTVTKADLDQAINDQLLSQVPAGFNTDNLQQSLTVVKTDKGKTTFKVKASAQLLPQINKNDLAKKLVGLSSKQASDLLSQIPNVTKVDIALVPSLPNPLLFMPRIYSHIDLQILTP